MKNEMKQICPYCGSENEGNAFCMQCGKLLFEDTELEPQRTVRRPKLNWAKKSNRVKGIALLILAIITIGVVAGALIILSNQVSQTTDVQAKLELIIRKPIPEEIYLNESFRFEYIVSTEHGFFDQTYRLVLELTCSSNDLIENYVSIDYYEVWEGNPSAIVITKTNPLFTTKDQWTAHWYAPIISLGTIYPTENRDQVHCFNMTVGFGFPNENITFNARCET